MGFCNLFMDVLVIASNRIEVFIAKEENAANERSRDCFFLASGFLLHDQGLPFDTMMSAGPQATDFL